MSAHAMRWVWLSSGDDEGMMHFLIESLLSDDPKELGQALHATGVPDEMPKVLRDDLQNLRQFREDYAEGMDDMTLAERAFFENNDDLMTIDLLERLNAYPAGRELLQRMNHPCAMQLEAAACTP